MQALRNKACPVCQVQHERGLQIRGESQTQYHCERQSPEQASKRRLHFSRTFIHQACTSCSRVMAFSLIGKLMSAANMPSAIVMANTVM